MYPRPTCSGLPSESQPLLGCLTLLGCWLWPSWLWITRLSLWTQALVLLALSCPLSPTLRAQALALSALASPISLAHRIQVLVHSGLAPISHSWGIGSGPHTSSLFPCFLLTFSLIPFQGLRLPSAPGSLVHGFQSSPTATNQSSSIKLICTNTSTHF